MYRVHAYVYAYVYVYACVYVCLYAYVYLYFYVRIYVYVYEYMCICICVRIFSFLVWLIASYVWYFRLVVWLFCFFVACRTPYPVTWQCRMSYPTHPTADFYLPHMAAHPLGPLTILLPYPRLLVAAHVANGWLLSAAHEFHHYAALNPLSHSSHRCRHPQETQNDFSIILPHLILHTKTENHES